MYNAVVGCRVWPTHNTQIQILRPANTNRRSSWTCGNAVLELHPTGSSPPLLQPQLLRIDALFHAGLTLMSMLFLLHSLSPVSPSLSRAPFLQTLLHLTGLQQAAGALGHHPLPLLLLDNLLLLP